MPRKYTYPPDDELVELFDQHRTYSAVGKLLDIPRVALKGHVRQRPALHTSIKGVTEGVKEQYAGRPRTLDLTPDEMHERRRKQIAEWQAANRQRVRELNRQSDARRTEEQREHKRAQQRRYNSENPERKRRNSKRWWDKNPGYHKQDYWNNRQQHLAWAKVHGDKRRRAAPFTPDSIDYIKMIRTDPCAYCGGSADSVDHIVPVAHGGDSSLDNLVSACRFCNTSKHARTLLQFLLVRRR